VSTARTGSDHDQQDLLTTTAAVAQHAVRVSLVEGLTVQKGTRQPACRSHHRSWPTPARVRLEPTKPSPNAKQPRGGERPHRPRRPSRRDSLTLVKIEAGDCAWVWVIAPRRCGLSLPRCSRMCRRSSRSTSFVLGGRRATLACGRCTLTSPSRRHKGSDRGRDGGGRGGQSGWQSLAGSR
jgi:hypothetical protein